MDPTTTTEVAAAASSAAQAGADFDLVRHLLGLTMLGSEWVLWLLLILSALSLSLMVERIIFFIRIRIPHYSKFCESLTDNLLRDDLEAIKKLCYEHPALESQMILRAVEQAGQGAQAMDRRMESYIAAERPSLDRGLVVLGTLGNNAPFIGLFGTVIGIIKAFADLAANPAGGPSVVMAGISEALVATAVGLLVAIPAVVAYNGFNRAVKRKIANADSLRKLVVAHFMSTKGV